MAYFEKLNYTLSNEDTRVEHALLPENARSVFAIAGSGARVLPLIARDPAELEIIDLAREQLHLCELRIAAARALSHSEYLFLLGYRGGLDSGDPASNETGDSRLKLFERLELSPDCREFWRAHARQWEPHGFVLLGKWENHFQKLGKIFRRGLRMDVRPVFEAQSLEEQRELYRKHFKPVVFRNFLRVVASEFVFNKFLYKGHFSGSSGHATESRAPWRFIDEEFRRLFTTTLVRKNYFLQVLFLGRIYYEEGLPLEAQPAVLEAIKRSKTRVIFTQGNLLEKLPARPFDFISLSDTISYLSQEDAARVLELLHAGTPAGARMVIRSFLKAPTAIRSAGWTLEEDENRRAHALDGTGVYQFHIFRKNQP